MAIRMSYPPIRPAIPFLLILGAAATISCDEPGPCDSKSHDYGSPACLPSNYGHDDAGDDPGGYSEDDLSDLGDIPEETQDEGETGDEAEDVTPELLDGELTDSLDGGDEADLAGPPDGPDILDGSGDVTGRHRGTCESDADCPGARCVAVPDEPDGWHLCESSPRVEATSCDGGDPGIFEDECCTSADCTGGENGICLPGPIFTCGGTEPNPHNVCVYDGCGSDADCTDAPNGICVPRNAFSLPAPACSYGGCLVDAHCRSRSGGQCDPFFDPCNGRFAGFFCTYADSECRSDADCRGAGFDHCAPGADGEASCEEFIPPP